MTSEQPGTADGPIGRQDSLRPDRVLARRAGICFWIALVLAVVGGVLLGLASRLGNTAVAVGVLTLVLVSLPLLIGLVFLQQSRRAARLIAGKDLLAVWTCTPEEWLSFAGKKIKRYGRVPQSAWIGRKGACFRGAYYAWTPKRIERFTIDTKASPPLLMVIIGAHGFVRAMSVLGLLSASNQAVYAADTSATCKVPIPAAALEQAIALAVALGVKPVVL